MLQIHQFPCLEDNYGFLAHDPDSGETATIDTPDAAAILGEAAAKGWKITQIWNTHWHPDHAGGNAEIKAKTGAVVSGPAEIERIGAAPDRVVREGDVVEVGGVSRTVASFELHEGSAAGEDGSFSAFNNSGQLAFAAHFTDGASAVLLVSVPEPSMQFLFGAAALMMCRRRHS